MEKYKYTCNYCQKEYIPTKRGRQKYCKDGCRSRAYQIRKKQEAKRIKFPPMAKKNKVKIEQMSLQGIGNATAGTLIADAIKSLISKTENKPVTNGDLKKVMESFDRYHPVSNLAPREDGALPHFDMHTNEIVHFGGNNTNFKTDSLVA